MSQLDFIKVTLEAENKIIIEQITALTAVVKLGNSFFGSGLMADEASREIRVLIKRLSINNLTLSRQ